MPEPARITAQHWLDEGLDVLREHGEQSLTIERLCGNLGRTKGSFYHHFGDLSGYLDALLAHWETRDTKRVIGQADSEPDPARRRARLHAAVAGVDTQLDVAVRAWGLRDARPRAVVDRVDERRIKYLAQLHHANGVPSSAALRLGRIEYAAFVGAAQLFSKLPLRSRGELQRSLNVALGLLSRSLVTTGDRLSRGRRRHGPARPGDRRPSTPARSR